MYGHSIGAAIIDELILFCHIVKEFGLHIRKAHSLKYMYMYIQMTMDMDIAVQHDNIEYLTVASKYRRSWQGYPPFLPLRLHIYFNKISLCVIICATRACANEYKYNTIEKVNIVLDKINRFV